MTDQPAQKQPFWEAHALPAPGTRMNLEAFMALPEVNFHMELIDGVVVYPHWNEETMSPSPVSGHQRLVVHLLTLLAKHIPHGDLLTAPMDVRLGNATVQPDIFWIAEDSPCIDTGPYFDGPPDLIVEVLSASTALYDRRDKFALYQSHGVREYWLADPNAPLIEVYTLRDGTYHRHGAFTTDDTFTAPVLNASLTLHDIFT